MKGNLSLLRLALALLAACWAGGCTKPVSTDASGAPVDPKELQAKASPAFVEVPMPVGFKYDEDRSRSATWPGGEYIDHFYTGSSDRFEVARFYRKQMPLSGWLAKPEDQSGGGIITQEYDRQGKTCRVRISNAGVFTGTEIHVTVFPNPQAAGPAGVRKQ
jgi:hypothetical protein